MKVSLLKISRKKEVIKRLITRGQARCDAWCEAQREVTNGCSDD